MGRSIITLEKLCLAKEWLSKQDNGQIQNDCPFSRAEIDCKFCSLVFGYPLASIHVELWGQGLLDTDDPNSGQYIARCPCIHSAIGQELAMEMVRALVSVMDEHFRLWDTEDPSQTDEFREKRMVTEVLLAVGIVRFTSRNKEGKQNHA